MVLIDHTNTHINGFIRRDLRFSFFAQNISTNTPKKWPKMPNNCKIYTWFRKIHQTHPQSHLNLGFTSSLDLLITHALRQTWICTAAQLIQSDSCLPSQTNFRVQGGMWQRSPTCSQRFVSQLFHHGRDQKSLITTQTVSTVLVEDRWLTPTQ